MISSIIISIFIIAIIIAIIIGIVVLIMKGIPSYHGPRRRYPDTRRNKCTTNINNIKLEEHKNLMDKCESNEVVLVNLMKTTVNVRNIFDLSSCPLFSLNYKYGEVDVDQMKQDIAKHIHGDKNDVIIWIDKMRRNNTNLLDTQRETMEVDFAEIKDNKEFSTTRRHGVHKLTFTYYNKLSNGIEVADNCFYNVLKEGREDDIRQIIKEVKILQKIKGDENIVKFHSFTRIGYESLIISHLYIEGRFNEYIMEKTKLDDEEIKMFLKQILSGLSHIHQNRIIHLDINCDNMLMSKEDKITKLTEFSSSVMLNEGEIYATEKVNSTSKFMAPELLKGETRKYDKMADMWSVGCSIVQMATGQPPFSDVSEYEARCRIYENNKVEYDESQVSDEIKQLIIECIIEYF